MTIYPTHIWNKMQSHFRYIILRMPSLLMVQHVMAFKKTVHIKHYAKQGEDVTEVLQDLVDKYKTIISP